MIRIRALSARLEVVESTLRAMECRPQLRRADLARQFGVRLETISRAYKAGRLPQPVFFSGPLWTPQQFEGFDPEIFRKYPARNGQTANFEVSRAAEKPKR